MTSPSPRHARADGARRRRGAYISGAMDIRTRPTRRPSKGWIRFIGGALLAGWCSVATAQHVGEQTDWVNRDWFTKDTDPKSAALLTKVDRAHLATANFFKKYNAGEYDSALGEIQYCLWVFPNHPKALLYLGRIAIATNRLSMPIEYFQKAIQMFPQRALTHAQYGFYLEQIGETDAGVDRLKVALSLDPDLAPAYAWIAVGYAKQGRKADAAAAAQRARELGFTAPVMASPTAEAEASEDLKEAEDRRH